MAMMPRSSSYRHDTSLDALAEALRECRKYASSAETPPEAILWCDPGEEFAPILPVLRTCLPNLLSFGPYEPTTRTGPALWLRAAAARQVTGIAWPEEDEPAKTLYKGRARIEQTVGKLKRFKRIALRGEKTAENAERIRARPLFGTVLRVAGIRCRARMPAELPGSG
ncbi:MAG: hypothetical protein AB7H90_21830 [Alphaproteobacteria bacterium]